MVRSGKISGDSQSMSQAKKSARATAKFSRELEEKFAPETPSMIKPVPVTVDTSPVQILRKPEAVTASSLAPPVPTDKNSLETMYMPPGTVTTSSQGFALPPPQDSCRDALSIPVIRSRMNYSNILIEYAYLIDVENCSSEDEIRSHGELLAENRRGRRRLSRK